MEKFVTVWLFLAIDSSKSWLIPQLDINNAFFHGQVDEDLYVSTWSLLKQNLMKSASSSGPYMGLNKLLVNGSTDSLVNFKV